MSILDRTWVKSARKAMGMLGRTLTEIMGGAAYSGTNENRLLADWATSRSTGDDDLRVNIVKLRNRARDLERNNALIRNYLRLLGINVVGPDGFMLQAQVRDNSGKLNKRINDSIEEAWGEWCLAPTIDGRSDMTTLMRTIVMAVARDGEVFVRKWLAFDNAFGFALEVIDPDLVDESMNLAKSDRQNEVRMGVEVDEYGRPVAFHVYSRLQSLYMGGPRERMRIPASEIIHLYHPERVRQNRGASWLASIMVPAKMLDGYVEAALVGARVAAAKMGFFERKMEAGTGAVAPADSSFIMEANPGSFGVLPDGYTLSTFDPNNPSSEFGAFTKDATRRIAVGLGVSYNGLASDLEGVNYSSMRSGLLIERDLWRTLQKWFINAFIRKVYPDWLNMASLTGALKLDSRDHRKFMKANWSPRGWSWVDPLKDTQAGVLGIQTGLVSRTDLLAEQGRDLERTFENLKAERELAELYGLDITGPKASSNTNDNADDGKGDEPDDGEDKPSKNGSSRNGASRFAIH